MLRFSKLHVIIILSFIFIAGCRDKGTEYIIPPADGRVAGSVHGIVTDNYSQERIAGATIQYLVGGQIKTVTTDSLGYYFINGLGTGEYEITVYTGGNYSKTKAIASIPSIEEVAGPNPSSKDYSVSLVRDIYLYKLNAGAKGKLYAKDGSGNMKPVPGATIIFHFSESGIEPSVYTTQTDGQGNYIFDQCLPAYNSYYTTLYSLPFNMEGIDYGTASSGSITLIPGVNINVNYLAAQLSGSEAALLTSPLGQNNYDPSGNLDFVFSKAINVSSIHIELRRNDYYGTDVYFEAAWSAGNTMLSINPYSILRDNTQYYVSISGKTEDNINFEFYGYITTRGDEQFNMIHTNLEIVEGTYTSTFPVDANIELMFNSPVDAATSSFTLQEYDYPYAYVTCQYFYSQDGKTLTINPDSTLKYDFDYYLVYTVYSLSGYYTSDNIFFKTAAE